MNHSHLLLVGQRIRDARRRNGITQAQLAEIVDLSPHHVGQMERGEASMSLDTLIKVAEYFNLSFDYLLSKHLIKDDTKSKLTYILSACSNEEVAMFASMLEAALPHLRRIRNIN